MGLIKRHEMWRKNYRFNRDLDHLSSEVLSERIFDCMNNLRVRTEQGQLGLLPPEKGENWTIRMTEVLEECALRGYAYPGPINISGFACALENAFKPIPSIEAVIQKHRLAKQHYLIKFGDPKWLRLALESGKFLISPASFYEKAEHNHARRDEELTRLITPNPRDPRLPRFLASQNLAIPPGKVVGNFTVKAKWDYYLFSLSATYSSRLFGDFSTSGCLVIHNPSLFIGKLTDTINKLLRGWESHMGLITYYDPVRVDPSVVDARYFKPFRHAYQKELRLTWTPPAGSPALDRFEVETGPLHDCAELVDLESRPPFLLQPLSRQAEPREEGVSP